MNEIRLTFSTHDFGAISQMLVDLGISFRVEPMKGLEAETVMPTARMAPPPARAAAKKPARGGGAGAQRPTKSQRSEGRGVSAADLLRQAITRNQASVPPPPPEAPDRTNEES